MREEEVEEEEAGGRGEERDWLMEGDTDRSLRVMIGRLVCCCCCGCDSELSGALSVIDGRLLLLLLLLVSSGVLMLEDRSFLARREPTLIPFY